VVVTLMNIAPTVARQGPYGNYVNPQACHYAP